MGVVGYQVVLQGGVGVVTTVVKLGVVFVFGQWVVFQPGKPVVVFWGGITVLFWGGWGTGCSWARHLARVMEAASNLTAAFSTSRRMQALRRRCSERGTGP